jgi:hypothetical protein
MKIQQGGLAAVAALGLVLGAAPAGAMDLPIPGKISIVKDGKLAKLVAKPSGGTFTIPAAGGPSDPTANPSQARFFATGCDGSVSDTLTGGAWVGIGNPPGSAGYKYKNVGAPGSGAVKIIILKPAVIKILAKDDGTINGPITGSLGIDLTTGADTYCAEFGGTEIKNQAALVKKKEAAAPGSCPAPGVGSPCGGGGGGQVCGDNNVEAPETCDDGNATDCGTPGQCVSGADFCPSDCTIDACANPADPMGPRRNLDISVSASLGVGQSLGTVRVHLEYPEGVVIIPGSADQPEVVGSLSMFPPGANCIPNDLDYGLLQACLSFSGYAPGQFTRVGFVDCDGGPPVAGDFSCRVIEATDQIGSEVSATCSVTLQP